MNSGPSRVRFMLKASLKRYFLTGLLVITPIWGTFLILKTLFIAVDSILGDLLAQLVPDHYVPGLGIVTLILLVFMTGLFAANFMGKQIVKLWEGLLNRVPLVRGIYSTLKSMMDILSFSESGSYHRVRAGIMGDRFGLARCDRGAGRSFPDGNDESPGLWRHAGVPDAN